MKTKSFKKYLESRLTKEEIEEIEKVSDSFSFIIEEKEVILEDKFNQMFNAKILAQIVECAVVNDHDKAIELSKKLILPK